MAAQTMILFSGLKSWTLKQTESWGESKTCFKGEVYGLKKEEGEGRKNIPSVLPAPPPYFFFGYLDGGRVLLKNTPALKGIDIGVIASGTTEGKLDSP